MRRVTGFMILMLSLIATSYFFLNAPIVEAADLRGDIIGQVEAGADSAGFGEAKDPRQIAAEVIKFTLSTLGTLFIILMVMSGYWYITARGEEDKVAKAAKTIRAAIIGIILVLLSYAITDFVTKNLLESLEDPEARAREKIEARVNKEDRFRGGGINPGNWNWWPDAWE